MIIHSIRLKNIKSYSEGPDGNGITVTFQSGVNRIAGKNGHGKTTLIESLGYALFLTKPQFEETFDVATYFLRAGRKTGEIDVTFGHGEDTYRIERGLGLQNKRRSKVVQLSDGSTCAEGEEEVSAFLCRLLGFADQERFSELFSKLVGVKQGRLTWPFDSKPGEAKRFFEPLLDVSVFRDCYDRLKPAVDRFDALRHEQDKKLAGVTERIRERQDSPTVVESERRKAFEVEQHLGVLTEALASAQKVKHELESKETAIKESERQRDGAKAMLELARQRLEDTERRVQESQKAAEIVVHTTPAHLAYEQAEKSLKELRSRQVEQRRLEKEKAEATRQRTELDGKSQAACSQADTFAQQKRAKESDSSSLREKLDPLRKALETNREEFEKRKATAAQAGKDLENLRHFVDELPEHLSQQGPAFLKISALNDELAAWNAVALETARQQEGKADQTLQDVRKELAGTKERHRTLSEQLKEISGGVCPFLKEQCRQFDPSKVQADLEQLAVSIKALEQRAKSAQAEHQTAKTERERLQRHEAGLAEKRRQLQGLIREFIRDLANLVPSGIPATTDRLQQWAESIEPLPAAPPSPAEDADLAALATAQKATGEFVKTVNSWWFKTEDLVSGLIDAFRREQEIRVADQQNVLNLTAQLGQLEVEIAALTTKEKNQRDSATVFEGQSIEVAKRLTQLEQQLQPYASLAENIRAQEQLQESHRAGYQQYLGAKSLAEQLSARLRELKTGQEAETNAAASLKTREAALEEAHKDFEPQALTAACKEYDAKNAEVAKQTANLANAKAGLQREEKRFHEWRVACAESEKIGREISRLQAAVDLTELARDVIKNSAPTVAQHLCSRISTRAQQIFNQINHDPVELAWDATRYSLRITPGDRHFAMLSGGEQTKLALAMTLAMLQEFSGLRFCVFDEPTYSVDADSRQKLADAILEAQKAAGLDQLLLVSHDDAFEGKIEHAVLLRKTAANGTEVALAQ